MKTTMSLIQQTLNASASKIHITAEYMKLKKAVLILKEFTIWYRRPEI